MTIWDFIIPHAEFAYNNLINSTIKKTHFEAAYGLEPQHVLDLEPSPKEAGVSDDGEGFAEYIQQIHEEIRAALKAINEALYYCCQTTSTGQGL